MGLLLRLLLAVHLFKMRGSFRSRMMLLPQFEGVVRDRFAVTLGDGVAGDPQQCSNDSHGEHARQEVLLEACFGGIFRGQDARRRDPGMLVQGKVEPRMTRRRR